MPGERNLETLLAAMQPALEEGEFVFCAHTEVAGDPVCVFREAEAVTLILRRAEAERLGLPFTYPCRKITLTVHSSLEAVGFLAEIAASLAAAGISANFVSAYYHDHLFVPADRAEEAMRVLRSPLRTAHRNRP